MLPMGPDPQARPERPEGPVGPLFLGEPVRDLNIDAVKAELEQRPDAKVLVVPETQHWQAMLLYRKANPVPQYPGHEPEPPDERIVSLELRIVPGNDPWTLA